MKIIVNAHRVNEGMGFITNEELENIDKMLIEDSKEDEKNDTKKDKKYYKKQEETGEEKLLQDFFFINEKSKDKILYNILTLSSGRLKNYGDYDFLNNIQIITPTKKGELGTKELNKLLQQAVNPSSDNKKERKFGDSTFREGDRIMQIKNNYDIYWEKKEPYFENGSGVFNGEFGTIGIIDDFNKQIKIKFDDEKEVWYQYSELEQIEHAYAITVHKAQRK